MESNVHCELRYCGFARFLVIAAGFALFVLAPFAVIITTKGDEQRWADAVILSVERTGIGHILDLAERLHANAQARIESILASPFILEAEAPRIREPTDLPREEW
ncbi:MAG: hypothetical protein ACXWJ4_10430, partial [Methyloceanibacter sp.]